uniref:PD-(D/E)XK nuclease family protein n=1 Tax=Algoriphagus sp. TaxID=1872435 RepID=UPI004048657C
MNPNTLPVDSILERDVDLILLEELATDKNFCVWFIKELNLPKFSSAIGAWKSISSFGLGETDILFSYHSFDKRIFVLIENKLDAVFQEEQYNRYSKRVHEYLIKKECDYAFIILVAPKIYCENQSDFENYLTYEAIQEKFESRGTKRNLFKSNLLRIASEKLKRGYKPVNSAIVQNFWNSYWDFKEEKYPSLKMKKPGIIAHNSDWPMLFDARLKDIVFYHKLRQGNADATFKGVDEKIELKIKEILPKWAKIENHSASFSIKVFSGSIDRTKDFNGQIENIKNGLQNIERIRDWIIENRNWIYQNEYSNSN